MAITIRVDEFGAPADIDGVIDATERTRLNCFEFDILSLAVKGNKKYTRYNYVGVSRTRRKHRGSGRG